MPLLTGERAAELTGGRLVGDGGREATTVVADSRAAGRYAAFAAIRGGHDFVADALAAGAPFVIVERPESLPDDVASAVVVDDVVAALSALAADAREQLDVRVVGITGSTGKTLTKDLIAAALRVRYRVHATPGSYNAEIGVPLTVLGCPDDTGVLVVELGARRPGEIAELCELVRPDIGVITGVGTTHLELFGTREAIAATKSELLTSLPADGLGIVPSDDDFLGVFNASTSTRMRTVGPGGSVRYRADRIDGTGRTHGEVWIDDETISVRLPVPNRALLRNAALAIAVAAELDIDAGEAASALAAARLSSARMDVSSVGAWTVVNDAYNANPTSVAAAMRSARELARSGEVWAVLGPMAELGDSAERAHRRMGRLARGLGYAGVIVVTGGSRGVSGGRSVAPLINGLGDLAHPVDDLDEAAAAVARLVPGGAVVLVKASRSVGLDRLVEMLVAGAPDGQT